MKPHLVRWHRDYAEKGLVVIDIDNGAMDAKERLGESVKEGEIPFPVLWDKDGANCTTYGIKGYPAAFLVGVDGTVIWEGFPLPKVKEIEPLIVEELKKVKPEDLEKK